VVESEFAIDVPYMLYFVDKTNLVILKQISRLEGGYNLLSIELLLQSEKEDEHGEF
jgi:hypothetical protein